MKIKLLNLLIILTLLFQSCDNDDGPIIIPVDTIEKSELIENYASIVFANYQDAIDDAQLLKVAIDDFVLDPTETKFNTAKAAWKVSRESYGTTEAFRFASGPIDFGPTEDVEGWLNAWPLDEVYIDYVNGDDTAGIINDLSKTIDKASLIILNGGSGGLGDAEKNVAIGYHAIEFLLWGQDLTNPSEKKAGQRSYTDYVDGGTAQNQDRRRAYIAICGEVLVDHLQVMIDEWKTDGAYRATFLGQNENENITNIINSIAELASSELAIERMSVAYDEQNQEDEHSCFSDNTHRDIRLNLQGVVNVYRGSYGNINGVSIEDLIAEKDATLGAEISSLLATAISAVDATGIPFDFAITDAVEGPKVEVAFNALIDFGEKLVEGRVVLGL